MLSSNTHLALLALLLGAQQGDSRRYRTHHPHHHGQRLFNPSPSFMSDSMANTGTFRPFHAYPRGGGLFTSSAGPLLDVFQEVMGDIKKGVYCGTSDKSMFCVFVFVLGEVGAQR